MSKGRIIVACEPAGLEGRPCVAVRFPSPANIVIRLSLEDAESFADLLLQVVREGEAKIEVQ